MKKYQISKIVLVLALVFGGALAAFAVFDSPDTTLAMLAGKSAIFTVLVVAVLGASIARKKRKGQLDNLLNEALPEKEKKVDILWPIWVAVYFFVVMVFLVMALCPERELIEVATVAARVAGWIFLVSAMCMSLSRHIGGSRD